MRKSFSMLKSKSQVREERMKEARKTEHPKWDLVDKLYAVHDAVTKYRKSHLKFDLSVVLKCAPDCPAFSSHISDHCTCGLVDLRESLQDMEDHHRKHGRIKPGPNT